MEIVLLCPRWGSEGLDLADFLARARAAGYDGVELSLPDDDGARGRALEAVSRAGLAWVGQHHQTVETDFPAHRAAYLARLRALAAGRPLLVNAHTGRDHFSFEQNRELLTRARDVEEATGVPVVHETHRGRFSFAAHVTRAYLEALPWLRLCLDVSHWFNVAESWLEDQPEALSLAVARTFHAHARVGSPEAPQVADPRAPEARPALEAHLAVWDRVVAARAGDGLPRLGFTAEFGPRPYMPHLPYADTPLADQWEVNRFMKDLLRQRYAPAPG
jgi:sugar phosphate isomerase/epimerase